MMISHEVPFCLLNKSRYFNDYDYSLVHLFEESKEYFDFYQKSVELGRTVILDNSVFELGTSFDAGRYAYWIEKLKPTQYIIPDVLGNTRETLKECANWNKQYGHLPGIKIGVVQASTLVDAIDCYSIMKEMVDKVAIGFNYKFYADLHPHENKLMSWMRGRQLFVDLLIELDLIDVNQPHHLLGCSYMKEFEHYKEGYGFIESMDTSNPVVFTLKGQRCSRDGMDEKISTKLVEFMNIPAGVVDGSLLFENLSTFRSFVKRYI